MKWWVAVGLGVGLGGCSSQGSTSQPPPVELGPPGGAQIEVPLGEQLTVPHQTDALGKREDVTPKVSWGLPDAPWVEIMVEAIDPASEAAGHPPLRETPLEDGAREIRLWVGFGRKRQQEYLRVQIQPETSDVCPRIQGQALAWWHEPTGEDCGQVGRRIQQSVACQAARWGQQYGVCTLDPTPTPDWVAIYEVLVMHQIWELPGSAHHPEHIEVRDGTSLVVELRDGDRFRAYLYDNPGSQSYPAARHAAAMVDLVRGMVQQPRADAMGAVRMPPAGFCDQP